MFSSFSNSGFSMRYFKIASIQQPPVFKPYDVGFNTYFQEPALQEGLRHKQQFTNGWTGMVGGWAFSPTQFIVQRFNNKETGGTSNFVSYDGLDQKYTLRFITDKIQTQKVTSTPANFTPGLYKISIKMVGCELGYYEDHKIYVKIDGIDVFPNGLGFTGIGSNPTDHQWQKFTNDSFFIENSGDKIIELWSDRSINNGLWSNIYVAELDILREENFDGLDILPRSDIVFDTTNITTSSALITDYNFGFEKVSGEFKVTCSSAHSSYRAGYAFKSTLDTWAGIPTGTGYTYDGTNFGYGGSVSTSASGNTYSGEWLQIECPMEFNLKYFSYSHHRSVAHLFMRQVVVVASNDGINWNNLTTVDAPTLAETNTKSQLYGNTTLYKFYRYIVTMGIFVGDSNAGYINAYLSLITMKTYIP